MGFFDAHSDIWCDVVNKRLQGEKNVFDRYHLERFQRGNVEGSIFVLWVDPPYDVDYVGRTAQIMRAARDEIAECQSIRIVHDHAEAEEAAKDGKIYVFIGIEGMAAVGTDLSRIDAYYDFGARHGMLTWNEENTLASAANSNSDRGLTALGKEAVRIMQRKKMILDTSHLNEAGFWDMIDMTEQPIIASHSNAKKLCDVKRNLSDDQLRAMRDCGGVVGLNAFNAFVDTDRSAQSVQRLAEHAAHMVDVMGIDHVGCGFDFFEFLENEETMGTMTKPGQSPSTPGIRDCSEIPNLFSCLEKMGMTLEEREKIARGNFRRIVQTVLG